LKYVSTIEQRSFMFGRLLPSYKLKLQADQPRP